MKKLNILFFLLGLYILGACSNEYKKLSPRVDENLPDTVLLYVSPNGDGEATGETKENAADFLDENFWSTVKSTVLKTSVKVQFLPGDYKRAYNEKGLSLNGIGSPQNKLYLKGGEGVVFTIEEEGGQKGSPTVIDVRGSQNIVFDAFHFTGDGEVGYVLRFTKGTNDAPTTNILVKNCTFIDMEGVVYGASGCHYEPTSHVTYLKDTFMRVGIDAHSHFIYNAYGSSHLSVIDCYFEDCTGDFVRFRDHCGYGYVKGSTFKKTLDRFTGKVFIMIPQFNNEDPGNEYFATNYAFVDNDFVNETTEVTQNAISFYHAGFDYPGMHYLLTAQEGDILISGTDEQKKKLLLENFGIDTDKIRIYNNTFSSGIKREFALQTFALYGAEAKGFQGVGDITGTINNQSTPFDWEAK